MSKLRLILTLGLVLTAFAANSVLCRMALAHTAIDPAAFTLTRIASGALMLVALTRLTRAEGGISGSWPGAAALLIYATCFSFAYVSLSSGAGALLLFGAVQATMILRALWAGEKLSRIQWLGLGLALGGLVALMAPGVTAPEPLGAALMLAAGVAWGAYSVLGRAPKTSAMGATAGNFLRALPLAALVAAATMAVRPMVWDQTGLVYALASGAFASGIGYALWYAALPSLNASSAASLQLSVPVITAAGGAIVLGEEITLRLCLASVTVLGGIALVVRAKLRRI